MSVPAVQVRQSRADGGEMILKGKGKIRQGFSGLGGGLEGRDRHVTCSLEPLGRACPEMLCHWQA